MRCAYVFGKRHCFSVSSLPIQETADWRLGHMTADGSSRKEDDWRRLVRALSRSDKHPKPRFIPEKSALLVIDMQGYFLDEDSHAYVPDSIGIKDHIRNLTEGFRANARPVLFTRYASLPGEDPGAMGRWWKDVLLDGDKGSEISLSMNPLPSEKVIRKSQYSAFVGTELEQMLRSAGVEQVVIVGVLTHLCCETTARDAFMRGFDVFFVADATATKSLSLHMASLRTLADGFSTLVTTQEVLRCLQ
jgi:isochorismate hydrolase